MRSYGAIHEREYAGAESNTWGGDMVCDGISFNGMIENGEVWVRCDDPEFTAEEIMEHECTHDAIAKGEIDPDEVWRKLEEQYGREQMDAWVEDYRQALTGEGLSDLEIEEEIICDAMAGMNKFRGKLDTLAGEYGKMLETAKQEAERSRENQRGPPEANKKPAEVGGVKMSIVSQDGKQFVKAERQVLKGNDPEAWGRQMEQYINEEIRKGEDVVLPTSDGHILILTERSAYKMSDRHIASIGKKVEQLMSDESYARKGRIATHIDELIQVAKFQKYRPDKNGKHENDIGEDGFNYYDAYFEDFNGGYYQVTLSSGINDAKETVYSIGEVRKRRTPAGTGSSSLAEGAQNGRSSSGDIIRASGPNSQEVKTAVRAAFEKALAEKSYVAVMLQRDNQNQRLYLHDVVTETEKELANISNEHLNATGPKDDISELYTTDILLNALNVKPQIKTSEEGRETDIRFSASGTEAVAALEAQNDALKEQVRQLNRETAKLRKQVESKTAQVNKWRNRAMFSPEKVGREILKAYSSNLDEREIHDSIDSLIAYASGKEGMNYTRLKDMAGTVAKTIVEHAETLQDSDVRQLTAQQEEYFKDFKVRDEDGRLLVMYKGGISTTEGQKRQVCVCIPALSYLLAIGEATPPERVSQLRCI